MLLPKITIPEFKATYYYREELVEFCKANSIAYSGLMKIDLEANIIAFLGGQKPGIKPKASIKNWVQDKLALDAEVTLNYKSNEETRTFFQSVIGPKFRFCGAMMKHKQNNPGEYVTYQDLVDIWYKEQEYKKQGKSSTKQFYKANRYNSFVKQYFENPDHKGKAPVEMLIAWEVCKKSGKVNEL
jgi:SAP domain-containing new25/Domain of unknown function (DUF6434)